MRSVGIIMTAFLTLGVLACGHTKISSAAAQNTAGDFESESYGIGTDAGDEFKKFAEGVGAVTVTKADDAYTRQQEAHAQEIAHQADFRVHASHAPEELADALRGQIPQKATWRMAMIDKSCATANACATAHVRIAATLVGDRRITLLDRSRTDALLREQRFQLSDAFDRTTTVELGALLGATHLLIIDVLPKDTTSYTLAVSIVDAQTGATVASDARSFLLTAL